MKVLEEFYLLNDGKGIPKLGFGTWQIENGETAYNAVSAALKNGYRHIDSAQGYGNEESVGKAIRDSGIERSDVFLTTKIESHIKDRKTAIKSVEESLNRLDIEYIDLLLIHAPWPWSNIGQDCEEGNVVVYKVMEEFLKSGKVKSIGVSNFSIDNLKNILSNCDIIPAVNQIPYFIGLNQTELINFCDDNSILIEAYSPLGIGYLLANEKIQEVAKRNNVTTAQVCIKYLLNKNTLPLPKTVTQLRMIENAKMDFCLNEDDMLLLDEIEGDPRRWE